MKKPSRILKFEQNEYGMYKASAANGDLFYISHESDGWELRTWNAAYKAWLGDKGPIFRTLKEAKEAAEMSE